MQTKFVTVCVAGMLILWLFPHVGAQNSIQSSDAAFSLRIPMLSLERSACRGTCPSYRISVFADGKFTYDGARFVKQKGSIQSVLSSRTLERIRRAIKQANYFGLRSSYTDIKDGCTSIDSDSAYVYLSVNVGGQMKSVSHYTGCHSGNSQFTSELRRLTEFENKIDEILGIHQWIGNEDERKHFRYPAPND